MYIHEIKVNYMKPGDAVRKETPVHTDYCEVTETFVNPSWPEQLSTLHGLNLYHKLVSTCQVHQ